MFQVGARTSVRNYSDTPKDTPAGPDVEISIENSPAAPACLRRTSFTVCEDEEAGGMFPSTSQFPTELAPPDAPGAASELQTGQVSRATPLGRPRYQTSEFPTTSQFPTELATHIYRAVGSA